MPDIGAARERKDVRTIEGLAGKEKLHPLQQSFVENFAVQCGFCTPGMIMTAKGLLKMKTPTRRKKRSGTDARRTVSLYRIRQDSGSCSVSGETDAGRQKGRKRWLSFR